MLGPKQRLFVQEYLIDKNATRAAVSAGYSKKTARSIGAENLTKPDIAEAIEKGLKEQLEIADLSADRILKEIGEIAFSDMMYVGTSGKLRALELLGKHFGLFTAQIQTEAEAAKKQILQFDKDGLKRIMKELEEEY